MSQNVKTKIIYKEQNSIFVEVLEMLPLRPSHTGIQMTVAFPLLFYNKNRVRRMERASVPVCVHRVRIYDANCLSISYDGISGFIKTRKQ